MHSQIVNIDLDSFTQLLETIHTCHKDLKSKLSKICMINDTHSIAFDCCDLKVPVHNVQVLATEGKPQWMNLPNVLDEYTIKDLQYEEVIFIDDNGNSEPKSLRTNFDSVFVNIEEFERCSSEDAQNGQSKASRGSSETDPLLVEQNLSFGQSVSVLEKALASNVFKVSAKNFLPKVVDWSSGSIENISKDVLCNKKNKYPPVLVCEFCGLQFSGKDRVYTFFHHRNQFHTQEVRYKCPLCSKPYWGERELSAHVASHVGKEHTCEFCGINFQRKNDLIRHLLIHEDKKFSCQFCEHMRLESFSSLGTNGTCCCQLKSCLPLHY